jgi:hypothetical protein
MLIEDYSFFAANNSLSKHTIDLSQCEHGGSKHKKVTKNEMSRMVKQLLNSVLTKYHDFVSGEL